MAKIDIDAYESDEILNGTEDAPKKRKNKRKADKTRRAVTRALVLILSAACVVGAYPAGQKLFDRTMASDKEVEIIPGFVLDLIPSGLFGKILDKVGGAAGIGGEVEEPGEEEKQDELEAIDDPNILSETTPVSDTYLKASVFLGDERLLGFVDEDLLNAALIYGESGMSAADFLEHEFTDPLTNLSGTAASILPAREPEHIYLCMGLNGITEETYIDTYKELIEAIKASCPGVPIVVCSLLPINEEAAYEAGLSEDINNGMINSTNKQMLSMVRDEGAYFLNAYSKFVSDNSLKENYDSGNGIILSDDGYEAWLSYIQKHAVPSN